MRITDSVISGNLLNALDTSLTNENNSLTTVETGRTVNVPSDNPAAAALYVQNRLENSSDTQYLQNISTLTGSFQVGDAALGSAVDVLTRAITLGTQGANGTVNAQDRSAIAQEVSQLHDQMINIANTTFHGQYIFAGTNSTQPAYVANTGNPNGVQYNGNTNVNKVEVAQGVSVDANQPGSQIFDNGSGSAFLALQDLANALNSNNTTSIQSAVTELNTALNEVSAQRTFYGTSVNGLSSVQTYLNNAQMQLASQENTLVGADMPSAITAYNNAQTARNAVLEAGGRISQSSLLDFLR